MISLTGIGMNEIGLELLKERVIKRVVQNMAFSPSKKIMVDFLPG